MQKKLTIVMDIDGTIIDDKGQLDPNVLAIFEKADFDRTNFVLSTANSYTQARGTVFLINSILKDKTFKPWISTSCGSTIYNPNGEKVFDDKFDSHFVGEYIDAVKEEDPNALIMFRCDEKNYLEIQPKLSKNYILMYFFKRKEHKKGVTGMEFIDIQGGESFKRHATSLPIQNLFTVSMDKEAKKNVSEKLKTLCVKYFNKYKVYDGFAMITPATTKETAVRKILELDETSTMPSDIKEVVYIGDGNNDAKMLSISKYGVARGKGAKPQAIKNAKYHFENLGDLADALYGDEANFEERMNALPLTDISESIKNSAPIIEEETSR